MKDAISINVILKNILAVDSSTKACSVALNIAGTLYSRHEILPQKHAHRILPMVDEVIKEAAINPEQIDLLAFGEGPGAFTGIRIAAGVTQGLALGWDKPVLPVNSLSAMAEECATKLIAESTAPEIVSNQNKVHFCSMLDARMNEVYVQCAEFDQATHFLQFEQTKLLSPDNALTYLNKYQETVFAESLNENVAFFGCGDVETEYPTLTTPFSEWFTMLPNAISLTKLAQQSCTEAKTLKEEIPVPVYLRNRIADTIEERKKKQQLKNK